MARFTNNYHSTQCDPKSLKQKAHKLAKILKKYKKILSIDAIACTGNSGQSMAYPVSMLTGIPVLYVRKKYENCNSRNTVEGSYDFIIHNYVIIDDFIHNGETIHHITGTIQAYDCNEPIKCVGILLHSAINRKTSFDDVLPILTAPTFSKKTLDKFIMKE